MIFYFSATGNSKYVATHIASATAERMVSISECWKQGKFDFEIGTGESIGFVTPTYFWGLPMIVTDFLQRLTIAKADTNPYCYHVLTYGTSTGQAHRMMARQLKQHGLAVAGKFIVQMPDTWTPFFDLRDQEEIVRILARAEGQIAQVVTQICSQARGDFNNRKMPLAELYYATYRHRKNTAKFRVNNSCRGCGLCQRQCPLAAIEMKNGKPVWTVAQCSLCLGCLHRCPSFSIQYGKHTHKHGQYVNPNVSL